MRRSIARSNDAAVLPSLILVWLLVMLAALAQGQAPTGAGAARDVLVQFPMSGEYRVQLLGARSTKRVVESGSTLIKASELRGITTIRIVDITSGKSHLRPAKNLPARWVMKDKDFNRMATVLVQVLAGGKPVGRATVLMKTQAGTATNDFNDSPDGVATFEDVALGPVEVSVRTRQDGEVVQSPVKTFRIDGRDPAPFLKMEIPGQVESEPGQASAESAPPTPVEAAEDQAGLVGRWILAGIFVAGIAYVTWRFLPKYRTQIDAQLAKVGVQIPQDPDPGADDLLDDTTDDPPAPPVSRRQPVEPIFLGEDATVTQGAGAVLSTPPQVVGTLILSNPITRERFDLPPGTHVVSRESGAGLSLVNQPTVSRQHAEIVVDPQGVAVRDLGSTNGTYVNGVKLESATLLRVGDVVQFGEVRLRVEAL